MLSIEIIDLEITNIRKVDLFLFLFREIGNGLIEK